MICKGSDVHFNGGSCRTNYAAMKTNAFEGGTVYKYPESHKQCQLWIQSLPNQSKSLKITHNTHICYKPFPLDCPKKKIPGDALVLTVVPSIFGETNSDYVMQTATPTRKLVKLKRNFTVKSRAQIQKHMMIKFWIQLFPSVFLERIAISFLQSF